MLLREVSKSQPIGTGALLVPYPAALDLPHALVEWPDAHDLPPAQHGKNAAQRLARYRRMTARRKPKRSQAGSKGYCEAKRPAAKLHRKVSRQRQDTGRKWAKKVVRDHDRLAVEDFRPKFLAEPRWPARPPTPRSA